MLWLRLAILQQNYSQALYSSLQNSLASYNFGCVMGFKEKKQNCENNYCKGM